MGLPESDIAYLQDRGLAHELVAESGMTCLVLPGWELPAGFDRSRSDLLIRLPAGYPDLAPDMWWFDPPVLAADGRAIPATEVREVHLGRRWQRWSRHFDSGQWQAGIDGLESYLALIRRELHKHVPELVR